MIFTASMRSSVLDLGVVQRYLNSYMSHGGNIWTAECSITDLLSINHRFSIGWIPELLLNTSETWLVDDLSPIQICLIGISAHVDTVFREWLKRILASYRSPYSLDRVSFAEHLFETTFGKASIERHFRTLHPVPMYSLFSFLCRTGSVSMIELLIYDGFDVNGHDHPYVNQLNENENPLGFAAAEGKMENVYMLLEAGANGSLAIRTFLKESKHLSDALFKRCLGILVDNARPASDEYFSDPLLAIIKSSRALCSYPEAPGILLDRGLASDECFGGDASAIRFRYSYMYQAISGMKHSVVELLLRNGARADVQISQSFDCRACWFEMCTWITFSVMCGAASCTDVFIKYGADVTALDGAGNSALRLAKKNALASHPRDVCIDQWKHRDLKITLKITANEDAETLAVVERAFKERFQGTMSLEDYYNLPDEVVPHSFSRRQKLISMLQMTIEKALRIVLSPTQIESLRDHLWILYYKARRIWSLPFYEALFMRLMYIVSYALLLAVELHALIKGHKRIPMPSRYFLSALAFLALALICGSSQMGVFWGQTTVDSKTEVGS